MTPARPTPPAASSRRPAPPAPWVCTPHTWGRRFTTAFSRTVLTVDAVDDDVDQAAHGVDIRNAAYMTLQVAAEAVRLQGVLLAWLAGDGR